MQEFNQGWFKVPESVAFKYYLSRHTFYVW